VLDVSKLLARPKSTVSRWMSALEQADFLERDDISGRYRLSLRLAALGEIARQTTTLQRSARTSLRWLTARTGETANLTVLMGTEAVNVEGEDSPQPVMHLGWVGRRLPVHATASGKVLIAHASRGVLDKVFAVGLKRFTSKTITGRAAFRRELERVRDRGYATVWAEMEPDLAAVAAPVRNHHDVVVAAIAIGGPVSRCAPERLEALAADVVSAADTLSASIGHRVPGHRSTRRART
jgi:DNA-binding IclR family transcriptional regulator